MYVLLPLPVFVKTLQDVYRKFLRHDAEKIEKVNDLMRELEMEGYPRVRVRVSVSVSDRSGLSASETTIS